MNTVLGSYTTLTYLASSLLPYATITAMNTALGSYTTLTYLSSSLLSYVLTSAMNTALNSKANIASPTFSGTVSGITATMVGLANVNNTTDLLKPVSTATQTALNLKANLASPTFSGTVSGITSTMVGLGNCDNTTDLLKPVSNATQTALNLKATIASPTFTANITLAVAPATYTSGQLGYIQTGTINPLLPTTGYISNTIYYLATITLPAGAYMLNAQFTTYFSASTIVTHEEYSIGLFNYAINSTSSINSHTTFTAPTSTLFTKFQQVNYMVNLTTTTTYYATMQFIFSAGTGVYEGGLSTFKAIRVG